MAMTRKDSTVSKLSPEGRILDELTAEFERDALALNYETGSKTEGEDTNSKEDQIEDVGFEEDEADDYSDGDDDDGGFQDYEDWKEDRRAIASDRAGQILNQGPVDGNQTEDTALRELILSIHQDSFDLGLEIPTTFGEGEDANVAGEAEEQGRGDVLRRSSPNDSSTPSPFIFRPLPIRQPASMPAAPQHPPGARSTGQQPLPQFVPPVSHNSSNYIPFRPTGALYPALRPFSVPDALHRPRLAQSVPIANPSLPNLPRHGPTQPPAPQVPTQTTPAAPPPVQATHYAGPSRRLKPKTRLASNSTPRLPNGTIDFEVKTCLHEMKRDGSEFDFNGNHNGNQKCARVLKRLYPHKFPDRISVPVSPTDFSKRGMRGVTDLVGSRPGSGRESSR